MSQLETFPASALACTLESLLMGSEPGRPGLQPDTATYHPAVQAKLRTIRSRESALQSSLADATAENLTLRRETSSGWQSSEPAILQLKQLLLEPAINREFSRLREKLQQAQSEARQAREDLEGAVFNQVGLDCTKQTLSFWMMHLKKSSKTLSSFDKIFVYNKIVNGIPRNVFPREGDDVVVTSAALFW